MTYLAETCLAGEARAAGALHDSSSGNALGAQGGPNADVAVAL